MKSKVLLGIILIIISVVTTVLIKNVTSTGSSTSTIDPTKTDFLGQLIEPEETVVVKSNSEQTQKVETVNLEECIQGLRVEKTDSFSKILELVKLKTLARGEVLESIEYQLEDSKNQEIVIQQNLFEVPKNQIRVFRTSSDGFPDRVQNYPKSDGNIKERLAGALTLGQLKKKIEKYKSSAISRGELTYEKENGYVVKINFDDGRKQLICETSSLAANVKEGDDQSCSCHSF